ncbi:MAG TPA: right-handed parallel beta-helix repeat-containing protein [Planctomycetota bacterium]
MKLALASAVLFPSLLAAQATIRVPADVPTIQGAIELAQDGDTVLVAAGTYGELVDFLGKAITVTSENGAAVTTIDATGLFDSVVRFGSGEGPDSVLRGFTVTGGNGGSQVGGIHALGASPRIEACIVRGNTTAASVAAGVGGNVRMVDCLVEGNIGFAIAGGVWGEAVLRRCTVRGNQGYDAGGIALLGSGRATDCVITGNTSEEGTYGGGVNLAGAATSLVRCVIAENTAVSRGMYPVSSAGVFTFSASGAPLILNCTVVRNAVVSPHVPPGEDCGGIQGPAQVVNTIVRDNDGLQIGLRATPQVAFSNVAGGHPGPGNFDLDPLFVDPASGDYHLQPGSPCVDAGAPQSPPDPDGTRADVGAFHLPQAFVVVRNGTGLNPILLTSVTAPRIGADWHARVDSSFLAGAGLSVITVRTLGLDPGLVLPQGELLVDGSELHRAVAASSGGTDDLLVPIPNVAALVGRVAHAQGILLAGRRFRLGNALELHLGH